MDFLTADEETLITQDFADLVSDEQLKVAITYKQFSSKQTIAAGGSIIFTNTAVNSFKMPLSIYEINASNGKYQIGDIRFFIKTSDITTVKKDDRIQEGSSVYMVRESTKDPIGVFHSIIVRNLS